MAELHPGPLRCDAGGRFGDRVEPDDDRLRRLGEADVVLGHGAETAVDDVDAHLVGADLCEAVANRFE